MSQANNIWDSHTINRISKLHPFIQQKAVRFILQAQALGIKLRVTSGFRSMAEQQKLYDQGRTTPGNVITNAKPGQSFHNYGLGFDVVEIKGGAALWNNPRWRSIGELGKSFGLYWGGDWNGFKDKPHFQSHSGSAQAAAQKVKALPGNAGKSSGAGSPEGTVKKTAAAIGLGVMAIGITIGYFLD